MNELEKLLKECQEMQVENGKDATATIEATSLEVLAQIALLREKAITDISRYQELQELSIPDDQGEINITDPNDLLMFKLGLYAASKIIGESIFKGQ